ncbi:MAG: glycosyltransferase, partial [Acidobacteriaceae bacterium]|nr:glycosyltransferase [Acidobacteriaceae bacterium]
MGSTTLPAAILFGRQLCKTEYFCFLDDDDVLLPAALATRLKAIQDEQADVVVTSGIGTDGTRTLLDPVAVRADPLGEFLKRNWLTSCAGLYRASTVTDVFFKDLLNYLEWSCVAIRLLESGKKLIFHEAITYQLFDTANSASKQLTFESLNSQV